LLIRHLKDIYIIRITFSIEVYPHIVSCDFSWSFWISKREFI